MMKDSPNFKLLCCSISFLENGNKVATSYNIIFSVFAFNKCHLMLSIVLSHESNFELFIKNSFHRKMLWFQMDQKPLNPCWFQCNIFKCFLCSLFNSTTNGANGSIILVFNLNFNIFFGRKMPQFLLKSCGRSVQTMEMMIYVLFSLTFYHLHSRRLTGDGNCSAFYHNLFK